MESCHYCSDMIDKLNCEYDEMYCKLKNEKNKALNSMRDKKNTEIEKLKRELEYKDFLIKMKDKTFIKLQKKPNDFIDEEDYNNYIKSGKPIQDEINIIEILIDEEQDINFQLNDILFELNEDFEIYKSKGFIHENN